MKILVTGATGFLGATLCRELAARGHSITPLSSKLADLTQPNALDPFNNTAYDQVFHLAAWTQAGDFCLSHSGEQWVINQRINTNVLAWWQKHQPQAKMITIGTSCAYDPSLPLVEENYLLGTPVESLSSYAYTKRMMYVGLVALQKQYGLKHLTLVPSTLYGPGYHTDGRQMHFIFDLARKILQALSGGPGVVLWGDGHQRRELISVKDFASIAISLSESAENTLVNIGAGRDYTIREFAGLICSLVGYDAGRIVYDTDRYVGAKSKLLNVQKLRSALPHHVSTPLDEGLTEMINWLKSTPIG